MHLERDNKGSINVITVLNAVRKLTGITEEEASRDDLYKWFHFIYHCSAMANGWCWADRGIPRKDTDILYMVLEVTEEAFIYRLAAEVAIKIKNDKDMYDKFMTMAKEGFEKYKRYQWYF